MRGQKSLYNILFPDPVIEKDKQVRPRNFYQPDRNEAIVYRYYYYAVIRDFKYEKCLNQLEGEFYLTSTRIIKVISDCNAILNRVMHESPTIKQLEDKFPHFSWAIKKTA